MRNRETTFSDNHRGLIAAQTLVPVDLNKLTESQVDAIYIYHGKFMTYGKKTQPGCRSGQMELNRPNQSVAR